MSDDHSVSMWILGLKHGDEEAATQVWERYFARLVRCARWKLESRNAPRRASDEEDVALSTIKSLCLRARDGKLTQLQDRDDLWRLLVVMTAHKVSDHIRHERRKKRGGGAVIDEGALDTSAHLHALDNVIGAEPSPEFAASVALEFEEFIGGLGDPELRKVALLRMENHTTEEIAEKLGCSRRKVARKIALLREQLSAGHGEQRR